MQRQERLKVCMRKSMPERGRCFSMGQATFSGPVAKDKERFAAAAKNSVEKKGEQKDESDSSWLGRARTGSPWLCYARTGRQKSGILGNWRRTKPTPWERNSRGS